MDDDSMDIDIVDDVVTDTEEDDQPRFELDAIRQLNDDAKRFICRGVIPFEGFQEEAGSSQLYEVLNKIFGNVVCSVNSPPSVRFKVLPEGCIDNLKKLLCVDRTFEQWQSYLHKYHFSQRCSVVWRQNTVAYRCQTCGFSNCMSLCAECFENANHEGHDYLRFFSTVGGCCDCGNEDVMNSKGFCHKHRLNAPRPSDGLPSGADSMLRAVLLRLLIRLVVALRRWVYIKTHESMLKAGDGPHEITSNETNRIMWNAISPLVTFILDLCNAGSVVMDILVEYLLDRKLYDELTNNQSDHEAFDWRLKQQLREDFDSLRRLRELQRMADPGAVPPLEADNMLDELMIYNIRLGYPQELIDMQLNLLYDTTYRQHFATKFFTYYPYSTAMVAELLSNLSSNSREGSKIAERIVHISVQICSGSKICAWLQETMNVVKYVLQSANMMALVKAYPTVINNSPERFYAMSKLSPMPFDNEWLTVDVNNPFFEKYAELFVLTDKQNLLVHESIPKAIFKDPGLLDLYVRHIEFYQGICTEWRIVSGDHRVIEWVTNAQRAYNIEFDACSVPMHNLIKHVKTAQEVTTVIDRICRSLEIWFDATRLRKAPLDTALPPYLSIFHIPLHRHLSCIIFRAQALDMLTDENVDALEWLSMEQSFLKKVILHPILIHVIRAEVNAGMWTRNGQGMRVVVAHYCRPTITFSFQAADLILIRFAAANINQEFFLTTVFRMFHITECFAYPTASEEISEGQTDNKFITRRLWISYMLDGVFRLLLDLIVSRRDTEPDNPDLVRSEIVALLARQPFAYSQVRAIIPGRASSHADPCPVPFDDMINDVANFVEPDVSNNLKTGHYVIKDDVFDHEVCPVFCRLRSFNNNEFNDAMRQFEDKERLKLPDLTPGVTPWLGYRLYDFDETFRDRFPSVKGIAALITQPSFFVFMHKVITLTMNTNIIHTIVLQEAIYIMSLAVKLVQSTAMFEDIRPYLYHVNEYNESLFYEPGFHRESVRHCKSPRSAVMRFFVFHPPDDRSLVVLLTELFFRFVRESYPTDAGQAAALRHIMTRTDLKGERIYGTGMHYIYRLLSLLMEVDTELENIILRVLEEAAEKLEQNAKQQPEKSKTASDDKILARRNKMMQRKQAYLKALQSKGAKLMKHHMQAEGLSQMEMDKFDLQTEEEVLYECAICSESTPHSMQNPLDMFVQSKPKGVANNMFYGEQAVTEVMQCAPSRGGKPAPAPRTKHRFFLEQDATIRGIYPERSSEATEAVRLRTSVEVRSCGHFAHDFCFNGYMSSFISSQTLPGNYAIPCPMCRTPINAILPLKVVFGQERVSSDLNVNDPEQVDQIVNFYCQRVYNPKPVSSQEQDGVGDAASPLASRYDQNIVRYFFTDDAASRTPDDRVTGNAARFGFVLGHIEKLVLFAENGFAMPSLKRGSINVHVMTSTLAFSKKRDQDILATQFKDLISAMKPGGGPPASPDYPPLMTCDPTTLFVRLSALPLVDERFVASDRKTFVRLIYKLIGVLCITKALVRGVNSGATKELVHRFLNRVDFGSDSMLTKLIQEVYDDCHDTISQHWSTLVEYGRPESTHVPTTIEELIEYIVRDASALLSNLAKFAFMMSKELAAEDLTLAEKEVFVSGSYPALQALLLADEADRQTLAPFSTAAHVYIADFAAALATKPELLSITLNTPVTWKFRPLLNLPRQFDDLFSAFYTQVCEHCGRQPYQRMLCLLCGRIMCLTCSTRATDFFRKHILECGEKVCCFLSLNSTMITVCMPNQAMLWGTVYLDAHGEEDRNLHRGKPLFLSENRMAQLQQNWASQLFDERGMTHWFSLDQLHNQIRQSHHHYV